MWRVLISSGADPMPKWRIIVFLIVNAETGDTVPHVHRLNVNNDQCSILFGPVSQGKYYFYYLPYTVQGGAGFYGGHYLKPEADAENLAAKKAKVAATVVGSAEPYAARHLLSYGADQYGKRSEQLCRKIQTPVLSVR
jgi:hypothetical protein